MKMTTGEILQSAFEQTNAGMGIADSDGRWLKANPALCMLSGYSEEELFDRTLYQLFDNFCTSPDINPLGNLTGLSGDCTSKQWMVSKTGHSVRGVLSITQVSEVQGTQVYYMIRFEAEPDIFSSDFEDALALLKRSERTFGLIDVAMWTCDVHTRIIRCSHGVEKICGYSVNWFKENSLFWRHLVHSEDLSRVEQELNSLELGSPIVIENRIIHASGETIWVQNRIVPIKDQQGRLIRIEGVTVNITSRKLAEIALQESERKFKLIADHCNDLIGILDLNGKLLFATPSHREVLGDYSFQESNAFEYLHPDDKDKVRDILAEVIRDGKSRQVEFRCISKQGEIVYIECQGNPAYGLKGEVKHIIVVGRDITSRREAERKLRESEERYRNLVELSPIPIAAHEDGIFTYVNQASMRLFGADHPNQLIGRSCMQFIHPDYKPLAALRMAAKIEGQENFETNKQKILTIDGKILEVMTTGIPVNREHVFQGLIIIQDVTEEKRMEQELREREHLYHELQSSLDRFSREVFRVKKAEELNKRLIGEMKKMLEIKSIGIIELQHTRMEGGVYRVKENDGTPDEVLLNELIMRKNFIDTGQLHVLAPYYVVKLWSDKHVTCFVYFTKKTPGNTISKPKRVWLKTLIRYTSVLYDNLQTMEDLILQLEEESKDSGSVWLLRLLFRLSEKEREALSLDLHDSALQEQIRWYRRLHLLTQSDELKEIQGFQALREELGVIEEGLLDVIHQIRLTCNELRPPLMLEFGLAESLKQLFEYTQKYVDYQIDFRVDESVYKHPFTEDQMIALYRIVQELLANASKHSNASSVEISLGCKTGQITFGYQDNGIGLNVESIQDSFKSIGLTGIRNRVRSLGGELHILSKITEGFEITILIPFATRERYDKEKGMLAYD